MTSDVETAREWIAGAKSLLVLTGAGISAESGVPTFRGPGGYWRNRHFMELANPDTFAREPDTVWQWYCERRAKVATCEPNAAHYALATFAAEHPLTLITQNVDGLHERAKHPDVIRMHGSLWVNRCTKCGSERSESSLTYASLPRSPCCDALERPGIVWFGEAIPADAIEAGSKAVVSADLVLVIGTSGVVYPAAGLISTARSGGAKVIDVNPEDNDVQSDIALRFPASQVVPTLLVPAKASR